MPSLWQLSSAAAASQGIFSLRLTEDNALLFHRKREPDIAAKVGQHSNITYKRSALNLRFRSFSQVYIFVVTYI
jgi:hypothetical protein